MLEAVVVNEVRPLRDCNFVVQTRSSTSSHVLHIILSGYAESESSSMSQPNPAYVIIWSFLTLIIPLL